MLSIAVLAKTHVVLTTEGPLQCASTGLVEKISFANECTLQSFQSYVV